MDISSIETAGRIGQIVSQFIEASEKLTRDRDLQELGLTSMQMVNLMLTIEAEFNLTIPGAKLVPANFRTIDSIEKLLRELAH